MERAVAAPRRPRWSRHGRRRRCGLVLRAREDGRFHRRDDSAGFPSLALPDPARWRRSSCGCARNRVNELHRVDQATPSARACSRERESGKIATGVGRAVAGVRMPAAAKFQTAVVAGRLGEIAVGLAGDGERCTRHHVRFLAPRSLASCPIRDAGSVVTILLGWADQAIGVCLRCAACGAWRTGRWSPHGMLLLRHSQGRRGGDGPSSRKSDSQAISVPAGAGSSAGSAARTCCDHSHLNTATTKPSKALPPAGRAVVFRQCGGSRAANPDPRRDCRPRVAVAGYEPRFSPCRS